MADSRTVTPPQRTRLGLLIPGLGHLVSGQIVIGGGLLGLVGVLFAALWFGGPRLSEVVFGGPNGRISPHGLLAAVSWPLMAAALWHTAYRRSFPRILDEITYKSNRQIFLRTLRRHTTGMIGLYGVLILIAVTVLTPLIAPYDPLQIDAGPQTVAPCWAYPMGTDSFGRDILSRLLYGGRISLPIGFLAVFIAATVGTTLGALAAFVGGAMDKAIMFGVDGLLALPRLVLLITIVGLFRVSGVWNLVLIVVILGFTAWMGIARIVRSEVLSLKEQEFIHAARALGLPPTRILFYHLIPNAVAPVIVFCSLAIGSTMLAEASLSFLGLGVPPPTSTWGVMVNDGREPLRLAPWISIFPGFAIMAAVLSFNLLGDGLRDATDPKLRGTD